MITDTHRFLTESYLSEPSLTILASCGWWIQNIVVSDKTVTFYVGVTGESWSMALKNYNGTVEASTGGYSYGTHSLTATTYDTPQTPHRLELTYVR